MRALPRSCEGNLDTEAHIEAVSGLAEEWSEDQHPVQRSLLDVVLVTPCSVRHFLPPSRSTLTQASSCKSKSKVTHRVIPDLHLVSCGALLCVGTVSSV